MNLVLNKRMKTSMMEFNQELKQYFDVSRKFRSRFRAGSIIVVEKSTKTRDFLTSLIQQCYSATRCQEMNIIQTDDIRKAKEIITELSSSGIKVIVIDSEMVKLGNGEPLPVWLEKEHPRIPVLIFNCRPKEEDSFMKSFSERTGLIKNNIPMASFAEEAGLPPCCCQLAMSR